MFGRDCAAVPESGRLKRPIKKQRTTRLHRFIAKLVRVFICGIQYRRQIFLQFFLADQEHVRQNSFPSIAPNFFAEQQRCDLDEIPPPNRKVVQALRRVKCVPDFVFCEQFGKSLVPFERRILPTATDPEQF